ncbi:hypothetical protein [Paludisphaera soli]|uniref:hypothetical protein n=1 Tax=Paludisphaera soli TaxID=2712865 RepID=UPI0013EA25E6|nr:hypothetical protein [Paludisphaera soli]
MTIAEREELLRRLDQAADPSEASTVRVGQTYAAGAYPTNAARWYAMGTVFIGGTEEEGSSASFTSTTDDVFRAFNLSDAVPPVGSKHLCFAIEGRYVFRA